MIFGIIAKAMKPKPKKCPFCDVQPGSNFDVVYEEEDYIMFTDRFPAASQHYLVIPKRHVGSVSDLRKTDAPIVRHMKGIGERYLDEQGVPNNLWKFGFHIPPFTSVDHLHLHCFVMPFKNIFRSKKYRTTTTRSKKHHKSWGWFIEVDQAVSVLESGKQVWFGPC